MASNDIILRTLLAAGACAYHIQDLLDVPGGFRPRLHIKVLFDEGQVFDDLPEVFGIDFLLNQSAANVCSEGSKSSEHSPHL